MTEKEKIREHTGETGNASKTELGQALSKTPLTIEEKITNVNAGVGELLSLFKNILKKQENIEDAIERQASENTQNALNRDKKIEHIIQQINTMTNKNKISHDIFSGKDAGELQVIEDRYIQKGGIHEKLYIDHSHNLGQYYPEKFQGSIYFTEIKNTQNLMVYCINVVLALKTRGIQIENIDGLDLGGDEIFCTTQGFSWTVKEIKKAIENYCYKGKLDTEAVLKYIIHLYKKYN